MHSYARLKGLKTLTSICRRIRGQVSAGGFTQGFTQGFTRLVGRNGSADYFVQLLLSMLRLIYGHIFSYE